MSSTFIKRLDWYSRIPRDMTESSIHGAIISLVAILISIFLFCSNISNYLTLQRKSEMLIDHAVRNSKLRINLDVKFPRMPCSLLSLDITDIMGSHELDTNGLLWKITLAADGETVLEKEAVKQSSKTGFHGMSRHNWNLEHGKDEDKVRKSLLALHGCQIQGRLEVNKVPGSLHITTHSAGFFMSNSFNNPYVNPYQNSDTSSLNEKDRKNLQLLKNLDISHEIMHFSFGDDEEINSVKRNFQGSGILNNLDGKISYVNYKKYDVNMPDPNVRFGNMFPFMPMKNIEEENKMWKDVFSEPDFKPSERYTKYVPQTTIFEYYCNVVPTTYRFNSVLNKKEMHLYQFTANSNRITSTTSPSIYIRYGLSPVTVRYEDFHITFASFIVNTMGIVGGLFTLAGIVESIFYHGIQKIKRKIELGKFS